MGKKYITNQVFEEALSNVEYAKILNHACKRLSRMMDKDESDQLKRIALWKALRTFDSEKSKFTTHLYNCAIFECKNFIKMRIRQDRGRAKNDPRTKHTHHTIMLTAGSKYEDFYNEDVVRMLDLASKLDEETWFLLEQRFIFNYNYREIAATYGCTIEAARQKVLKAIEKAKQIYK